MSKYLLHDPVLKFDLFPNFLRSWFCKDNSFGVKRKFVLEFGKRVIRFCSNGHHYKSFAKLNICGLFMSCFEGSLTSEEERVAILDFFEEGVKVEYVRKRLLDDEGLQFWLDLIKLKTDDEVQIVNKIKSYLA